MNHNVLETDTKTGVNQVVIRIGNILHVQFFDRCYIIFMFFPTDIMNFDIYVKRFAVFDNFAIVKTGIRHVKINGFQAQCFATIFCLLRDNAN